MKKFEYSSKIAAERIREIVDSIRGDIAENIRSSIAIGKKLVEIRSELKKSFSSWLESEEWPLSRRQGYMYITMYEGVQEHCLEEKIDSGQINLSPTALSQVLAPKNSAVVSKLKEMLKEGCEIDIQSIKEVKKSLSSQNLDTSLPYDPVAPQGCRKCEHYRHSGGRLVCDFKDMKLSDLEKNEGLNLFVGCSDFVSKTESNGNIQLTKRAWNKVLLKSTELRVKPEDLVNELLLENLDKLQALEDENMRLRIENEKLKNQRTAEDGRIIA